jgi:hypothetical protein
MLIICRVYEDREEHRELPAVVKARVGCILKDDGRYKNISRSNDCRQQGQQYQTHQESSKPHITIVVKIFSRRVKYTLHPAIHTALYKYYLFALGFSFSVQERTIHPCYLAPYSLLQK